MRPEAGHLFFLATQGCKVNQYESQALREAWLAEGMMETQDPALADVVLVNSCAVTERAVLDLGKLVRGFTALDPKPRIVVTGCAVEADRDRVLALTGVDDVIAQKDKVSQVDPSGAHAPFPALSISNYHRARAVIKVQDGCSHGCTYCIIPSTRGASVSRHPHDVIQEAKRLLYAGIRELSLCGINLRHYGRDLSPGLDFWDLLAEVDRALSPRWTGLARLRIGSLEPADLTSKALDILGESSLMTPHLHLSLQSGSPEVLRRMGRGHYRPERIFSFLDGLRHIWPEFGLGADIITGFPGETDTLFLETQDVICRLPLTYAHVFPYSERPGTPAARFSESVPAHLRRERAKTLRRMVEVKKNLFLRHLLTNSYMDVVLEDNGTGMNEFYVECRVANPPATPRALIRVVPVSVEGAILATRIPGEPS